MLWIKIKILKHKRLNLTKIKNIKDQICILAKYFLL